MLSLGQLTHLPESIAANPFHRLIVKFSRYKSGSFEVLFTIEAVILRYAWVGLLVLLGLVIPPLEEVDYLSTAVRLSTLIYPAFFVWSLSRVSGVELIQLMLEGRWTAEILASPMDDGDFKRGFITPVLMVVRQYLLISVFSLALYELEAHIIVRIDDTLYLEDLWRGLASDFSVFANVVAWIVFLYLARLLLEMRLRNGLIKGLFTLMLILGGAGLFVAYAVLIFFQTEHLADPAVLAAIGALTALMIAGAAGCHMLLRRNFRRYLSGQLDIDPLIFDRTDPHASAWEKVAEPKE